MSAPDDRPARRPHVTRALAAAAGLAAALLWGGAAHADTAGARPPDPKVVELYRQARELVNAGRWDEACPKFEEAMAKQPTASILVNVGDCHEHFGKLAHALDAYAVARELNRDTREETRRAAIAAEIDAREQKLAPRVPRLHIHIENPVAGMVIRRNGEPVPADTLDTDIAVDPGPSDLTAEAPGHTAEPHHVVLKEGDRTRVTLRFEGASFVAQHRLSLAVAGGAVAFAAAGAALAGWTVATHGSIPEACKTGAEKACAERQDTVAVGSVATNVAFGVAGAAAVAAVLVFTVAERPGTPRVQAAVGGTFARVRVDW